MNKTNFNKRNSNWYVSTSVWPLNMFSGVEHRYTVCITHCAIPKAHHAVLIGSSNLEQVGLISLMCISFFSFLLFVVCSVGVSTNPARFTRLEEVLFEQAHFYIFLDKSCGLENSIATVAKRKFWLFGSKTKIKSNSFSNWRTVSRCLGTLLINCDRSMSRWCNARREMLVGQWSSTTVLTQSAVSSNSEFYIDHWAISVGSIPLNASIKINTIWLVKSWNEHSVNIICLQTRFNVWC